MNEVASTTIAGVRIREFRSPPSDFLRLNPERKPKNV